MAFIEADKERAADYLKMVDGGGRGDYVVRDYSGPRWAIRLGLSAAEVDTLGACVTLAAEGVVDGNVSDT